MGLIAHYKLDGNANDALGRYNGTASNVTWVDGKLGQAGSFTSSFLRVNNHPVRETGEFSLAFWVAPRSTATACFFCARTVLGQGLSIFRLTGGTIRFDFGNQWTTSVSLDTNQWNHIVLTRSGNTKSIYKNGMFQGSTTFGDVTDFNPALATIGCSQINGSTYGNYFDGLIDDYRIYDHALSKREVRNLSQGLVMHYPCRQDVEAAENLYRLPSTEGFYFNNAFDGSYGFGSGTNSQWSVDNSDQPFHGIPVQRVSRIESGVYQFLYLQWESWFTGKSLQPGETITFSFWYYGTYGKSLLPYIGGGSGGLRFAATGWLQQEVQVPVNKWHRVVFSLTNPTQEVQTCGHCWMRLHYDTNSVTLSNEEYWKFTAVQVEMKPHASDYTPDSKPAANLLTDASTQGNDATLTLSTSPEWRDEEYPAGRGYYWFSGDAAERIDRELIDCGQELTYACWVRQDSLDGGAVKFVLSSGKDTGAMGVNINTASGVIRANYGESGNGTYLNSGISCLGVWRHVVFTHSDLSGARLFVDGQLVSQSVSRPISHAQSSNRTVIGKMAYQYANMSSYFPFHGGIADVRIYSTALSADEVKELYQQRASLDAQGNFYAAMFNEMGLATGVAKSGIASFDGFSEVGITDGMVAYYPLRTSTKDFSGNGYDGVATGAIPVGGGFDGHGAYRFDGANSNYIRVSGQTINGGSWIYPEATFTFWINPNIPINSAEQNIITVENTFEIAINNQGSASSLKYASTPWAWRTASGTPINTGEWHFVAYVHSLTYRKLYVDGVEIYNSVETGGLSSGSSSYPYLTIGGRYSGTGSSFNGDISNVKIFNRALSPEEIAIEYKRTGVAKMTQHQGTTYIQGEFKEI